MRLSSNSAAGMRHIRRRLLAWFRSTQRDLPWRRDRDPYHIWVSEIMLQQTQVQTVIPYYERFLQRFPTVAALAAAPEQEVLRLWEGLGYYRRARNLHRAARQIVERQNGKKSGFSKEPSFWSALPGIGRYTLGAILSQAYDDRVPALDANSTRVLCRWFARTDDPRSVKAQRWLWATATRILPRRGAGEFNQALMELGALVCSANRPTCLLCPVSDFCAARKMGLQEAIPRKAAPPRSIAVREVAVAVQKAGSVLLAKRPATASRWANLWEFPHGEVRPGETDASAAERVVGELTGLRIAIGRHAATVRHGITRYNVTLLGFLARHRSGRFRSSFYSEARWIAPKELAHYPLSSPQRRLAAILLREEVRE